MQWTTVRLVVSENDGRTPSRQGNKTHKGEETLCFARGDETRLLGLEEDRTLKQWGLNAETRGGIEPMGKIFLLTFLFIGLLDSRCQSKYPPTRPQNSCGYGV